MLQTGKGYHDNKLVHGPAGIIVQSISGLGNLEWNAATMRADCVILGAIGVRTKEEGENSFLTLFLHVAFGGLIESRTSG